MGSHLFVAGATAGLSALSSGLAGCLAAFLEAAARGLAAFGSDLLLFWVMDVSSFHQYGTVR